jgi:ferritin
MVISEKIIDLLNYRIQQEEQSSRIYKAISIWLEFSGYSGAAKLFDAYSSEELKHANWAYQYLLDLNIKPIVHGLVQPVLEFKGLPQIIALTLKHELDITNQCSGLSVTCQSEGDYMTLELAQRYLKEQTEELRKAQYWIDRLTLFGTDPIALLMLDKEMGA